MSTFYLILEISALLGGIIFPLAGPKKSAAPKKLKKQKQELSDLYVNENGYLEYIDNDKNRHHHVH